MLTSSRTERNSVAGATAVVGLAVDPITRRSTADLPCRKDPDLWFADTPGQLELAKAFRTDCPARVACLAGALSRREPCGVWGGEIFDRGRIVAHKRQPDRPRRSDVAA